MNKNNTTNSEENVVIDATSSILGRIASYAAKQALLGKSIIIVNCKDAILTGKQRSIIKEYTSLRHKGGTAMRGPYFPKYPERIMKRTIRGMLPYKQQRGLDALKRVICYTDLPEQYIKSPKISIKRDLKTKVLSLGELSKEI